MEGTCDPLRDIDIIESELALADLEVINRKKLKSNVKLTNEGITLQNAIVRIEEGMSLVVCNHRQCFKALINGTPAHTLEFNNLERDLIKALNFLTMKKSLYVCNIAVSKAIVLSYQE